MKKLLVILIVSITLMGCNVDENPPPPPPTFYKGEIAHFSVQIIGSRFWLTLRRTNDNGCTEYQEFEIDYACYCKYSRGDVVDLTNYKRK